MRRTCDRCHMPLAGTKGHGFVEGAGRGRVGIVICGACAEERPRKRRKREDA